MSGKKLHRLPPQIQMMSLEQLKPSRRNARTHSQGQIQQVGNSIEEFGFINPIVVDENNKIVAGHARAEAAKYLGIKEVPIIRLGHLKDPQIRAYMLADNKLALNAGWDRELLAIEFKELETSLPEFDLDLGITGFSPNEVDNLFIDHADNETDPVDDIPASSDHIVSRTGDLFKLEKHRIIVGDSRDEKTFASLMQSRTADMAFLDPPYNVRISGHVGGRGRTKHDEFVCASGEMDSDEFIGFLTTSLGLCARFTSNGAISFVCMDWRHAAELMQAGSIAFSTLKNVCVWVKTTPGQGSFYRSQHELVFVYKHGDGPHINNFKLGANGRSRSNVWSYAGANAFKSGRMDELKMHPTVKPVSLIVDAMKDCSRRGSIVLDAFAGSGSTIVAAEQIGRRGFCIEIDPKYVDVAIRRWQSITGKDAILESTGETFDVLRQMRANKSVSKPA